MKEELDKQLCKKYPKIFRDRRAPVTQTAMCWGFSCGDGWHTIIDVLCSKIQRHIDHSRKERARALRYNRALKRALAGDTAGLLHYNTLPGREVNDWTKKTVARDLEAAQYRTVPEAVPQVVAVQVKEKFGGLRFYINGGDNTIHSYIEFAESMSYRTCEECGAPGQVYTDGWHVTLCEQHAAEQHRSIEEEQ